MLPRRPTLLAAVTCALLAVPAVASAKDFCVGAPTGCTGTSVAAGDLKAALTAAQSNGTDDRFFLAPGVFSADAFSHQSPERVQIIGAGAGKTTVRGDLTDGAVLTLDGNPGSSVSDLTLEPLGGVKAGLFLLEGSAHGVTVDAQGATGSLVAGAALRGGATFDDGRVDLGTISRFAVLVLDTATVSDSTLIAHYGQGVVSVGSAATVLRSTLNAGVGAVADSGHRDGRPRASDGDGDCTHVSDIGAFELQGTNVNATATAGAATAKAGAAVSYSADGSCIPGPGAPTIGWRFDDGASAAGAHVTHAFATPGHHSATVTIADNDGHHATAATGVEVTAAATPRPRSAPVISRLTVTPQRIAIGTLMPKLLTKPAKRPAATITFTLSRPATVELAFAKLRNRAKPSRITTRLRIKAKQGTNRIRFTARLTRNITLKPGNYRLTLTATDTTGTHSGPTSSRFTAIPAKHR